MPFPPALGDTRLSLSKFDIQGTEKVKAGKI